MPKRSHQRGRTNHPSHFENLEDRVFLSVSHTLQQGSLVSLSLQSHRNPLQQNTGSLTAKPIAVVQSVKHTEASLPTSALSPSLMDSVYGVNQINFGSITGNGAGQTIAIVDAYDDPKAFSDLQQFDKQFDLPDPPSFQRLNQNGVASSYPATDPAGAGNANGTWEVEESLDLDWAHAIAPDANIDLIEASSASNSSLISTAVNTARNLPGVVAVSMSFSSSESSGEKSYDTYFTTPTGHPGVTFLAATGDDGEPGGYPAYSPNVVAVGGTTLYLDGSTYSSESGWSGSGGGVSQVESQPSYQKGVVTQSSSYRAIPDVSFDADPNSGVAVYDSYDYPSNPWIEVGGTSLATPMYAGLVAIADQGRAAASLNSLDGATQTLPDLYQLPQSDFNDITAGNNGYAAGANYDLVTGRGSPIANKLVPDIAGVQSISGTVFQDDNSDGALDAQDTGISGATVYLDSNNNGLFDAPATSTFSDANLPSSIRGSTTTSSTLAVSGTTSSIRDVSVTLSITETKDSNLTAYLASPDGTTITLFSALSSTGSNFTNTTFSSSASTSIAAGSAPFTGTFAPSPGELYEFDNKTANGTWTLKITDSARSDSASLTAWSLNISTGELAAVTNSQGQYTFNALASGTYSLRQLVPGDEIQTSPSAAEAVALSTTPVTARNFADFPTILNDTADSDTEYLMLDPTGTELKILSGSTAGGSLRYEVPLSVLPNLVINLAGAGQTLYVDYANGDPIPAAGLTLNNSPTASLFITGHDPSQSFSMNATQLALDGGGTITYQPLDTFGVGNATLTYSGDFTINNLNVNQGSTFIFD